MKKIVFSLALYFSFVGFLLAQQNIDNAKGNETSPPAIPRGRAPDAIAIIGANVVKMGGAPPQDSVATGTVQVTAGSRVENGTIKISTRGLTQTKEEINVPSGRQLSVFTDGVASESLNGGKAERSLELASTAQSGLFPLPLLAAVYAAPDNSVEMIGTESTDGVAKHHLKFANNYGDAKSRKHLAGFSARDIWFDADSGLPSKISYDRRNAAGASPSIHVDILYSDYRRAHGFFYPYHIQKFLNGTLWADITIQDVEVNTGLSAVDFKTE